MHAKNTILSLSLFGMTVTPYTTFAADTQSKLGFHGNGEAGFSESTGNTVSTNFFGALKLNYSQKNNELKSLFELNYKSENKIQTQERYNIDIQNNRFYNQERSYFSFVGGQMEKSRFEGIELDTTISIGLGKSIFKDISTDLTGEIGIGQQFTQFTDASAEKDKEQTVARLKLALNHQFNTQISFSQDIAYSTGSNQSKVESNTGFKVKIADQMNLKATYKYRHNDKPAAGVKKVDTQTIVTLIYDF